MERSKMGHYESDGCSWDEGEIPKCSYCGTSAKDNEIYETVISGVYCCLDKDCQMKLANECIVCEIEYVEEESTDKSEDK